MASAASRQSAVGTNQGSSIGRQLLVALATVVALSVNVAATTLPLNGQDTGAISDSFTVFFVPAGYVFSIWGIIFIGWIAYTVYQFLPAQRADATLKTMAPWYIASAIANAAWLFAWHYLQFELSVAIILVLIVTLIQIYRLLAAQGPVTRARFWSLNLPFSIYFAWGCVATIANITATLSLYTTSPLGIGAAVWGAILVVVAVILGLVFSYVRADIGFVAVFVWALAGIAVKQSSTPIMLWSAAIGAALLALSLIYTVPSRRRTLAAAGSARQR